MKGKNLFVLVVVAALLVGLAYWTSRSKERHVAASDEIGKYVLPSLQGADALNKMAKIVVESGSSTITVAKVDDVWCVPAKHGYPVDNAKLREFVLALADLKVGQVVPADGKQMEALNLLPPKGDGKGAGTVVKFCDKGDAVLASLVVGKERTKKTAGDMPGYDSYPDGRFVAADGKPYLVRDTLRSIPESERSLLDEEIVSVGANDVVELTVRNKDAQGLTLKRLMGMGPLTVENVATNEEMNVSKVDSLASVLSYMTFSDVANPKIADAETGFGKGTNYVAKTKDGRLYMMRVGGHPAGSEDRYIQIKSIYEPPADPDGGADAKAKADAKGAEKTSDEARKRKEEREKITAQVREFNERVSRWIYLVKPYKVECLTVSRADVVKVKEEPKKEEVKKEEVKTAEPAPVQVKAEPVAVTNAPGTVTNQVPGAKPAAAPAP